MTNRNLIKQIKLRDIAHTDDKELVKILLYYAGIKKQTDNEKFATKLLEKYLNLGNILVAPITELLSLLDNNKKAVYGIFLTSAAAKKICWANLY